MERNKYEYISRDRRVKIPEVVGRRIMQLQIENSKDQDNKRKRSQGRYKMEVGFVKKEKWCPNDETLAKKTFNYTMPNCYNRTMKIKKHIQEIFGPGSVGHFELYVLHQERVIIVWPKSTCTCDKYYSL